MELQVYCSTCKEWKTKDEIQFEDISEDAMGYDVVTFTCNDCGNTHKSQVRG